MAIFNLQGFSFTCLISFLMPLAVDCVVAMVMAVVKYMYVQTYMAVCTTNNLSYSLGLFRARLF